MAASAETSNAILRALAAVQTRRELAGLMGEITHEFRFRHYALIHHDDLRGAPENRVNLKDYPASATARIIDDATWRRDPVIRGCAHIGRAFLWSELGDHIQITRADRLALELGAKEGLNQGITVPHAILGQLSGSCTFAGTRSPDLAEHLLGMAQLVGIFAFQAAKRLLPGEDKVPVPRPRLQPRPRDCVVLTGCGFSNKEIARALGLTPRTVDGYLTDARRLFEVNDRTELVISALIAGEVDLAELRRRQPEHLLGL